jgi:hypothetical protein
MKRFSFAVVLLSFVLVGVAQAQFPGKLRRGAEEALKEGLGKKEDRDKQAGADSRARPPARKDKDRKYAPGLSFSTVLNGVLVLPKNGNFQLNRIQATFIPDGCEGGFVVLRKADGTELYQYDWKPDRLKKPYTLLNFHQTTDLQSGEKGGGGGSKPLKPGDYVLDFYLPTEHFYTFPFSIKQVGGDDPFGEGQCFVTTGDWERWGYLYYVDANPERNLVWKVWLCNDACGEKDIKVRVEVVRDADGDLVCTSRPNTTYSVQPKWSRREFDMVFPEGKDVPHGTYFKAKDLLRTDGAYTLTMKIDDKVYGTWKFVIENGKPQYTGRTVRAEADPLTFVEGGRDAFWYARE